MKIALPAVIALLVSGAAFASSHREAPAIANDPAADNTDVYAFVSTKTTANDTLNIVANWIPFEEPSGGPNFFKWSDDVQYQIHIHQGNGPISDSVVYTFRFKTQTVPRTDAAATCSAPGTAACVGGGKEFFSQITGDASTSGGAIIQTYTVTRSVSGQPDVVVAQGGAGAGKPFISAPVRIGPRTQTVLHALAPGLVTSGTYDEPYAETFIATTTDGTRVFAGPRDDGFYVDLGGVFDLANLRPKAAAGDCTARGVACTKAQDGLAGFNVHTIALEIPTKQLTFDGNNPAAGASDKNTIGIWATSNRRKVSIQRANGTTSSYGPWVQVSRLGLPLINEAVIGYQDKDKYNRTKPHDDVTNFGAYFLNPVIVPDAEAVGIYSALGVTVTDSLRHNRTDIIDIISLAATGCTTYPGTKCHTVALGDGSTGDVLRVDLGLDPATYGFPNGRSIPHGAAANMEQVDVTDVELSLLLAGIPGLSANGDTGHAPKIQDHVDYNDKPFLDHFPWLALPWEGFSEGHGKTTP